MPQVIEATGVVKNNKEPLKSISASLQTDKMVEFTLALEMEREDYLRLVRAKNLEQVIVLKIAIPQESLDIPEDPPVEATIEVNQEVMDLVPA